MYKGYVPCDKGYVPFELKIANLMPILNQSLYITGIFWFIFKLVYGRLTKYIDKHNILSNCQFGLKKIFCLYDFNNINVKITSAIDKGEHIMGRFVLDFAKAFETLNHDILLRKLNHYEIRRTVFQWF